MPSRSAWTWAMYHQARTCSSSLTASRKLSSLRLPRVGALHLGLGDRLLRRLALRALGIGGRDALLAHAPTLAGAARVTVRLAADRPGAGARLRVEQRRAVVLLGLGGGRGVAAAADRFPGAVVELVFAAVAAVGGDRGRVAAGLAGGDRVERRDARRRRAGWRRPRGAGGAARRGARRGSACLTTRIARWKRATGGAIFEIAIGLAVEMPIDSVAGAGGEGGCREGERRGQDRGDICAFCKQARDRCEIPRPAQCDRRSHPSHTWCRSPQRQARSGRRHLAVESVLAPDAAKTPATAIIGGSPSSPHPACCSPAPTGRG